MSASTRYVCPRGWDARAKRRAVLIGTLACLPGVLLLTAMAASLWAFRQLGPVDRARLDAESWRVTPQGEILSLRSTSPPVRVLGNGRMPMSLRPIAFGRIDRGDGTWTVLVEHRREPDRVSDSLACEVAIYVRNEEGYWLTDSPYADMEAGFTDTEWQALWARAERVEP